MNSGFPVLTHGLPAVILAPMEGVTDAPMRAFLTERGGFAFCVSEFLRVSRTVPPPKVFRSYVPEIGSDGCATPSGTPVQVQLLGGDPGRLAESALVACRVGARAIDLNFGCPAPTVNRHDGGATLLKYPERIRDIVAAVRAALPGEIPVSAKFRLGWDSFDAIHANTEMAAQGGASWVTIHGRTKVQGYTPPAYWGPIGEVRRRLGIPVVANGEIWTLDDFRRCRDETGCEHFMVGRGAVGDPTLGLKIARELGLPVASPLPVLSDEELCEKAQWIPLVLRFSELCAPGDGQSTYVPRRIKQWLRMTAMRRTLPWLDPLKRLDTFPEMLALLRN